MKSITSILKPSGLLRRACRLGVLLLLAHVLSLSRLLAGDCNTNCVETIIWQTKLRGQIGAQSFDAKVQPILVKKKLTDTTFLTSILGRPPTSSEVLALEFHLNDGSTNINLLVYNKASRTVVSGVTFNDKATLLMDGKSGTFTVAAPVGFTSITLQGGSLQLGGQVKEVRHVPSSVKCTMQGYLIAPPSSSPPYGFGVTGLVMRAKITTMKPPLKVDPPVVPNP